MWLGPDFGEGNLQGDLPPDTVMVVDPPDGKIPYQPWAAAKRQYMAVHGSTWQYMKEHLYDREEFISTRTRCFPAGLPRDMSMGSSYNGWQVVQAPGVVVILTEWNHTYRIIRLDGRPHVGSSIQADHVGRLTFKVRIVGPHVALEPMRGGRCDADFGAGK